MALEGNLKDFSLADMFRLLASGRKSGTLHLDRPDAVADQLAARLAPHIGSVEVRTRRDAAACLVMRSPSAAAACALELQETIDESIELDSPESPRILVHVAPVTWTRDPVTDVPIVRAPGLEALVTAVGRVLAGCVGATEQFAACLALDPGAQAKARLMGPSDVPDGRVLSTHVLEAWNPSFST